PGDDRHRQAADESEGRKLWPHEWYFPHYEAVQANCGPGRQESDQRTNSGPRPAKRHDDWKGNEGTAGHDRSDQAGKEDGAYARLTAEMPRHHFVRHQDAEKRSDCSAKEDQRNDEQCVRKGSLESVAERRKTMDPEDEKTTDERQQSYEIEAAVDELQAGLPIRHRHSRCWEEAAPTCNGMLVSLEINLLCVRKLIYAHRDRPSTLTRLTFLVASLSYCSVKARDMEST